MIGGSKGNQAKKNVAEEVEGVVHQSKRAASLMRSAFMCMSWCP